MMKTVMTVALAGAITLGLGACGEDGSPEDTVKELAQAAAAEDFARVCALLDPEYVEAAEKADGTSCEKSIKGAAEDSGEEGLLGDPDKLEIGDAELSEDGASAIVPTTYEGQRSQIRLVKVDDAWRVTFGL